MIVIFLDVLYTYSNKMEANKRNIINLTDKVTHYVTVLLQKYNTK